MVNAILRCDFKEDHIEIPSDFNEEEKYLLYQFVLQAILDAHLPVAKAIGFSLNASKKLYKQSAIKRCSLCLENMVEIASNLDDKIFLNVQNNRVISGEITGKLTADMKVFTSNTKPVDILYIEPDIMTTIKPLSIDIYVDVDCGYNQMSINSLKIGKNNFFPMNTYHTVMDYVRVLPYNGEIRYKLLNGMKPDMLKTLFIYLLGLYSGNDMRKEEREWVSSFLR